MMWDKNGGDVEGEEVLEIFDVVIDGEFDVGEEMGKDFVRDKVMIMESGWYRWVGGFGRWVGYMMEEGRGREG